MTPQDQAAKDDILSRLRAGRANGHAKEEQDPPEQRNEAGTAEPEQAEPIRTINFAALKGQTPPPRRFIVDQWIPAGCVTSLYGPGGIGKTLLAQQAATCIATGRPLFGSAVEKGIVLGLLAEDDDDELWRRQVRINAWLGSDMDELGNLAPAG
jgi:hypothetical protein